MIGRLLDRYHRSHADASRSAAGEPPSPRHGSACIELRNVSKQYGDTAGLKLASIAFEPERLTVVLGPSGCGKTTLLRVLAGLEVPDAGQVLFDGEDVARVPPQNRDVAMVFQDHALYPHRSVRGNIEYPLRRRGVRGNKLNEAVERIASRLGILPILQRRPNNLSGGEAQRVALARALVRQPRCFLLDEPLSNLDVQIRAIARAEIKELQRELGVTSVYVTHDQDDVWELADRVAIMRDGRILQQGSPAELLQTPIHVFVAGFFGSPPMNIVRLSQTTVCSLDQGSMLNSYKCAFEPGTTIEVGVSPWTIRFAPSEGVQEPDWCLSATVTHAFTVPGRQVVRLSTPLGELVACAPDDQWRSEWKNCVFIPRAALHFFDGDTGVRLSAQE